MMRFILFTVLILGGSLHAEAKPAKTSRRPADIECPAHEPRVTMLKTKDDSEFPVSVITPCEVELYFANVAAAPNIPFGYPEDGCYARAHEMSRRLERQGVTTGKVFVEGNLRVETKNSPKGYVEWTYHVAPVVAVDYNGTVVVDVLDPSIFNHAVTVDEWIAIQTRHQGASRDSVYQTNRFHYIPSEKDEDLNDYKPDDLRDMENTLQSYMKVLMQRRLPKAPPPPWTEWETRQ